MPNYRTTETRWTRDTDASQRDAKRWRRDRKSRRNAKWCEECR